MSANNSRAPSRRATFRAATMGLRAYTVAKRIKDYKPSLGVDYRGLGKRAMAEEFATSDYGIGRWTGADLREAMKP